MPRKLKVFRTATGFHDAYVAAPSRKAALEAWGSDKDLFARGMAEEVTEPALTREPLEHPGEVIRLSRGDLASQLKALGRRPKTKEAKPAKATKPKPQPKRDKLDAAEAALAAARERHGKETDAVERQLEALRAKHGKEAARLERARDKARDSYRHALEKWIG
jgi:hypothetical protein